ncbi:hypothetical protein B0J13DRAFT_140881 [Dactylonectria estremocensis]|uniref:Uncharacterized protein n=1 Tax=Dactylonectria estremocensis TaxID=1079267 RepID=A0A9P9E232_9HYPO|nr:hypothetical protein B0J13DRAFT_140881 [Dactylonectria estremocensis]
MAASRDTSLPKSILVFNQIIEEVARCAEKLAGIRSPANKYKEDVQALRTKLDAVRSRILQPDNMLERHALQAEIQGHTAELERLERGYESGVRDAEAEYGRRVDTIVKAFCETLAESMSTVLDWRDFERSRRGQASPTKCCQEDPSEPERSIRHPDAGSSDTMRSTVRRVIRNILGHLLTKLGNEKRIKAAMGERRDLEVLVKT